MVHDFTHEPVQFVDIMPATKVVRDGYPIAQQDGYLDSSWMDLNISHITNGKIRFYSEKSEGSRFWNSGPPYLVTLRDMHRLVHRWCKYVPKTFDVYPNLFAGKYYAGMSALREVTISQ